MNQPTCTPTVSHAVAGAALAAALEIAGHWAPWPRRLPRLIAYGYGVAAILVGAHIALDRASYRRLTAISAAAGLATAAGYLIDHILNQLVKQSAGHDRHH